MFLQEEHNFRVSQQFRLLNRFQIAIRSDFADDPEQIVANARSALRFQDVQVVLDLFDGFHFRCGDVKFFLPFKMTKKDTFSMSCETKSS